MKRFAVVVGATAILSGCAAGPPPEVPAPPPVAVAPPAPEPARDECGAGELQTLIGRPRLEAPTPVYPGLQRVACTSCALTQDYNPRRLNILFDADTGVIREIRCG